MRRFGPFELRVAELKLYALYRQIILSVCTVRNENYGSKNPGFLGFESQTPGVLGFESQIFGIFKNGADVGIY